MAGQVADLVHDLEQFIDRFVGRKRVGERDDFRVFAAVQTRIADECRDRVIQLGRDLVHGRFGRFETSLAGDDVRLAVRDVGFGGCDVGFVRVVFDFEELLARFDVFTFLDIELHDFAGHPGHDVHRVDGVERSDVLFASLGVVFLNGLSRHQRRHVGHLLGGLLPLFFARSQKKALHGKQGGHHHRKGSSHRLISPKKEMSKMV